MEKYVYRIDRKCVVGKMEFNGLFGFERETLRNGIYGMAWSYDTSKYSGAGENFLPSAQIKIKMEKSSNDDLIKERDVERCYSNELVAIVWLYEEPKSNTLIYDVYSREFLECLQDYMINFKDQHFDNIYAAENYLRKFLNEQHQLWINRKKSLL